MGINRTARYIKEYFVLYHCKKGQDFGSMLLKHECFAVHFICLSDAKSAEYTIIQYLFHEYCVTDNPSIIKYSWTHLMYCTSHYSAITHFVLA